jgi:hypothetical protein
VVIPALYVIWRWLAEVRHDAPDVVDRA